MQRARPFLPLLSLLGAAFGCSSSTFSGASTTADAGGDGVTTTSDGGALESGVSESGSSGPTFCSTLTNAPFLCADWDEGNPVDTGFERVNEKGGTVSIDMMIVDSMPGAMRAKIAASAGGGSAELVKSRPVAATSKQSIRLAAFFDVACTSASASGGFQLLAIDLTTAAAATPAYTLTFGVSDGNLVALEALSTNSQVHQVAPISPGKFHDLSFDVSVTGSTPLLTVSIDGTAVPSLELNLLADTKLALSNFVLRLGQGRLSMSTSDCSTYYDNVVWE
jgi:hypothetical protein